MNRLWLPGKVSTLCGLMGLAVTTASLTFVVVGLATERLKSASRPGRLASQLSDCKGVVACLHAFRAGRKRPWGAKPLK
eukprot:4071990-Amphidinium_carterae.1